VSKLDNGNALRPKEKQKRNEPEPDGDAAVGSNRGNNIQIEDGYNKKQNEVHAPQHTPQVRRILNCGRSGRHGGLVLQSSGLL
jgi:hypothetical protein